MYMLGKRRFQAEGTSNIKPRDESIIVSWENSKKANSAGAE